MWTASITGKTYNSGVLTVAVAYSNGVNNFTETVDITGGTMDVLNNKVQSKLATLNTSDGLLPTISPGPVTTTPVPPTTKDNFVAALKRFQSCQRAVSYGLITTADKVYVDALAALKTLYDPTFIDFL